MNRKQAAAIVELLLMKDLDLVLQNLDVKRNNIEIINAYAEGEDIQVKSENSEWGWIDIKEPSFNGSGSCLEYRIKPKTKIVWYRNYMTPTGAIGVWVASREKLEGQIPIGKNYKWVSHIMCQEIQCD